MDHELCYCRWEQPMKQHLQEWNGRPIAGCGEPVRRRSADLSSWMRGPDGAGAKQHVLSSRWIEQVRERVKLILGWCFLAPRRLFPPRPSIGQPSQQHCNLARPAERVPRAHPLPLTPAALEPPLQPLQHRLVQLSRGGRAPASQPLGAARPDCTVACSTEGHLVLAHIRFRSCIAPPPSRTTAAAHGPCTLRGHTVCCTVGGGQWRGRRPDKHHLKHQPPVCAGQLADDRACHQVGVSEFGGNGYRNAQAGLSSHLTAGPVP